jgi:hypothetical protein
VRCLTRILNRIAEPEPLGLGIETHYTSLRRFYTKNLPEELVGSRREEMLQLRGLAELCEAEPAPYDALIREFFTKTVFYQSLSMPQHDQRFRDNMRLLLDLRAQELKEKHLELQKERLETDKTKGKPDVTLQIFAGFQAQIEKMITRSLAQAAPPPGRDAVLDHQAQPLLAESSHVEPPDTIENPLADPPPAAAPSTEKHDSAPNSTL